MYTEEQARSKLCPFIRDTTSIPDVVAKTGPRNCVASECMAWRWVLTKEPMSDREVAEAGMAVGIAYALKTTTFERGYCGVSGGASGAPEIARAERAA